MEYIGGVTVEHRWKQKYLSSWIHWL